MMEPCLPGRHLHFELGSAPRQVKASAQSPRGSPALVRVRRADREIEFMTGFEADTNALTLAHDKVAQRGTAIGQLSGVAQQQVVHG